MLLARHIGSLATLLWFAGDCIAPRARGAYEPEQVHIGYTGELDNSVTIEWVTKAVPPDPPGSWVQFGVAANQLSQHVKSVTTECGPTHPRYPNWVGVLHESLLTGLIPGQLYHYRVGSQEEWSSTRTFKMPDIEAETVRVPLGARCHSAVHSHPPLALHIQRCGCKMAVAANSQHGLCLR